MESNSRGQDSPSLGRRFSLSRKEEGMSARKLRDPKKDLSRKRFKVSRSKKKTSSRAGAGTRVVGGLLFLLCRRSRVRVLARTASLACRERERERERRLVLLLRGRPFRHHGQKSQRCVCKERLTGARRRGASAPEADAACADAERRAAADGGCATTGVLAHTISSRPISHSTQPDAYTHVPYTHTLVRLLKARDGVRLLAERNFAPGSPRRVEDGDGGRALAADGQSRAAGRPRHQPASCMWIYFFGYIVDIYFGCMLDIYIYIYIHVAGL